jgi:hypothetical protein
MRRRAQLRSRRPGWRSHITRILERGKVEGVFRPELDTAVTGKSVIAEFHGILFEGLLVDAVELDGLIADVRARLEHWLLEREESPDVRSYSAGQVGPWLRRWSAATGSAAPGALTVDAASSGRCSFGRAAY